MQNASRSETAVFQQWSNQRFEAQLNVSEGSILKIGKVDHNLQSLETALIIKVELIKSCCCKTWGAEDELRDVDLIVREIVEDLAELGD